MKIIITEKRVYNIPSGVLEPEILEAIKENNINELQDLLVELSDMSPEAIDIIKVYAATRNAKRPSEPDKE